MIGDLDEAALAALTIAREGSGSRSPASVSMIGGARCDRDGDRSRRPSSSLLRGRTQDPPSEHRPRGRDPARRRTCSTIDPTISVEHTIRDPSGTEISH